MKLFGEKKIINTQRLTIFNCDNCKSPIHPERGFKKMNSLFYCSILCINEKLEQEERFRQATDPFNETPLNYKKKKWWQ